MPSNIKIPGIEYGPVEAPRIIAYSPDNGQGITQKQDVCTQWDCKRWENGHPIAPKLITNRSGFQVCPVCNRT